MPRLRLILAGVRRVGGWLLAIVPTVLVLLAAAFYLLLIPRLDLLRPYVSQSLSRALNAPVQVQGMHLSWNWGPLLELAALRVGSSAQPDLVLHGVHLRLFALPLLWGDLVAQDFRVAAGEVSVVQAGDGNWQVAGQALGHGGSLLPLDLDWARVDVQHLTIQWRSQPQAAPISLHVQGQSSGGLRPQVQVQVRWSPQGLLRYSGAARGVFTGPGRSSGSGNWVLQSLPLPWFHLADSHLPVWSGSVSGSGHLQWRSGLPRTATGQFAMHDAGMDGKQWAQIHGHLDWNGTDSTGTLQLADLTGLAAQPLAARLGLNWRHRLQWQVEAPLLPAVLLQNVPEMALPVQLRWIPRQQWQGSLRDLHFRARSVGHQSAIWELQAGLHGIGVSPHGDWFGVQGLSGDVVLHPESVQFHLVSQQFTLDWPQRFAAPLHLQELSARIVARKTGTDWSIQANPIVFQGPGHLHASLAVQGQQLRLKAQIDDMPVTAMADFVPQSNISPALRQWLLQAFQAGSLQHADLQWQGPWNHLPRLAPGEHFSLRANFRHVTLHYAPRWPIATQVNAQLLWAGDRLSVQSHRGDIFGVPVASASIALNHLFAPHTSPLQVTLKAPIPLDKLLPFLRETPVLEGKAVANMPLRLTGQGQLQLALSVPFGAEKSQVDGRIDLRHAGIGWRGWQATSMQGPVYFQRDKIRVGELKGVFAGGPMQASLQASQLETSPHLRLSLQGEAQAADLPMPERWRTAFGGAVPYQGSGTLLNNELHFKGDADLRQSRSALPAPLNWASGKGGSLAVQGYGNVARRLQVNFKLPLGSAVLAWQREASVWRWEAGAARLGGEIPPPLPNTGFFLQGRGDSLSVGPWLNMLTGEEDRKTWPGIRFDLHWRHLRFLQQDWPDVQIRGQVAAKKLHLQFASSRLAGVLQYARAPQPTASAQLRLDIQKLSVAAPVSAVSSAPVLSQIRQGAAGSPLTLHTRIAQLDWHGHEAHDVLLDAARSAAGWNFSMLKGDWAGSQWDFKGSWQGAGAGQSTFQGNIRSNNIAPVLRDIGMDTLDYGRADYAGKLSWPGAPWDFSAAHLSGTIQTKLWNGRLRKLGTDISWLIFLNPTTLFEDVLTFDYRPLYGGGLFFSKLFADFQVQDGVAHTRNLLLESSALEMKGVGAVDLAHQTVRMGLQVYPLQSFDLLLGHFPILGPAIFGKSGKVLEWRYQVDGPWAHPAVRPVHAPATTKGS
ncbi:YhdP family protein [Acidithiobacillus sp.]|uniref:YhdP family phospholipid transporter n=1 Tax=Acidithiobacillus sp. TaxID=1872118 RepID=UPI0025BAB6AF|nr:AsmA-like C-terminal domain-containing protein [Acidithiobacillus sp.]MCK9189702.1 AsmA-like C-terminal domain-containing protein [Acidithiobacillus sp.]MCK9359512.1 AsmA-like C-terminal domain-containing protein [Acidithiobacillus sp.]